MDNKIYTITAICGSVLLFILLSQPLWSGKEMVAEMRSKCAKVGGVMLEDKRTLGTMYECAERKD